MKLMTRGLVVAALICGVTLVHPETASANKCSAGKVKCVVNKTKALLGCHGKAAGKGLTVDPACLAKAKAKFDGGVDPAKGCFEKLEAKGEKAGAKPDAVCPTSNDTAAFEAKVDAFVADLVSDVVPTSAANKCAAGKTKCIATKAGALLGCEGKALGKSIAVDPACTAKAKAKFDGAAEPAKGCFEKLEAKGEKAGAKPVAICPTSNDTAAIEAKIDAFVADVVSDLAGGGGGPTPTPTPTPGPTATQCGAPGTCGNCTIDAGESCDPPAIGACGAGFTCTNCNCACPSTVHFTGDPVNAQSILDTGWTGISHRAPIVSNGDVTVALDCAASSRPCGTCPVTGPVVNSLAGAGQLDNHRCSNDPSLKCAADATCTAAANKCSGGANDGGACLVSTCAAPAACTAGTCTGGGVDNGKGCCNGGFCRSGAPAPTCTFYFGAPFALAAGGVSTCVVNQFKQPITGTANVESGDASTTVFLTTRVYNGLSIDTACPLCSDTGAFNDTVTTGTCTAGPHVGMACDANGNVPLRPDYGRTSYDCPPNPGGIIATLTIDLSSKTGTVIKTLSDASPNCSGAAGNKCICDTCNNANAEVCADNSDCPDLAPASIPAICGGKRCQGGANVGTACNANSECPGVTQGCGKPGEPAKPSACTDDTSFGIPNNHFDCSDGDLDGIGECENGPNDGTCSLASGHAQRGCTGANEVVDCGAPATCISSPRKCFLTGGGTFNALADQGSDTLIAVGMADTPMGDVANPTLGAVFCVAPTNASAINKVAGLPGPARVTILGTATGLP